MRSKFKSFLKLPGGGEINRCYYPLRLDTYGRGCYHDCLYCYSKSCLDFRKMWDRENPAVADPIEIERVIENGYTGKGKYAHLIAQKLPLRLGGMTDCFTPIDKETGVTRATIRLLNKHNHPYLILTKNSLVQEYADILDPDLAYVQLTITTPYDDISAIYEPYASPTSERLKTCRYLTDMGFNVAVRINPLFPKYPDGHYAQDGQQGMFGDKGEFRYFDWSLVERIAEAGASTVIAGFLRLSSWNIKWIKEKTHRDLTYLFNPDTRQANQALHFGIEEKRYYYERIKAMCDSMGLDFSVCYDGDEAYETFRYLWANQNDCCNGIGKVKGFTTTYDNQDKH